MTGWWSGGVLSPWHGILREAERLSIAQIAERLDRAPSTVKVYFYDPPSALKARVNDNTPG